MVRVFKMSEKHERLLRLLGEGNRISLIAKILKTSRRNIYDRIKILEREGYVKSERITKNRYNYYLTSNSNSLLFQNIHTASTTAHKHAHEKNIQRKHNLSFKCRLLRKPQNWEKDYVQRILRKEEIPFHERYLQNWTQYEFVRDLVRIRTTTQSVVFDIPEIYGNDTKLVMRKAWGLLEGAVSYAERVLNIQLTHPERENIMIINQHNAFIYNEIAEFCLEKKIDLELYDENGELRVKVDNSQGLKEFEFLHRKHQEEDSDRFKQNIKAMYDGSVDFPAMQRGIEQTSKTLQGGMPVWTAIANTQVMIANAMNQIAPSIKGMRKHLKNLAQRRLEEFL